jgi:hypothetical protein
MSGAAKRRGTYEERKAAAIIRNEEERQTRLGLIAKYEREKTPEQRRHEREVRKILLSLVSLAQGLNRDIDVFEYHPRGR